MTMHFLRMIYLVHQLKCIIYEITELISRYSVRIYIKVYRFEYNFIQI